jgi:hypothetical protein
VGENFIIAITTPADATGTINVNLDGVEYNITIFGGIAILNTILLSAGTHMLTATYSGDENYILARNYVGSFFDVEAPNAFITIEDVTASLNQETSITGKVTDMSNHPLSNVNVKIVVNDVDEYETVTNDEGVYSQAYTPNSMGTYTVTATINDENYAEKRFKNLSEHVADSNMSFDEFSFCRYVSTCRNNKNRYGYCI